MRTLIIVGLCGALVGCTRANAGGSTQDKTTSGQNKTTGGGSLGTPEPGAVGGRMQQTPTQPGPGQGGMAVPKRTDTVENASGKGTTNLSDMGDRKFVEKAASGGMAEVELGKLATKKAATPEVRQFAEQMVKDHSQANTELKQLASKKNFPLPSDVTTEQKQDLQKLSQKSGKDFDKAYMDLMVKDHDDDVKDFKNEASQAGADPEIKAWAQKTLNVLEEHDKRAHQSKSELKKGK